jgi:hypothetical protein
MLKLAGIVAFCLLLSVVAAGTTYRVGSARPYQTLQQVAPLLTAGDSVLVDGDQSYAGGIVFTEPGNPGARILVAGIRINGNRPVISGGSDGVTFRTDYPYAGPGADHYTFEGFEVSGATNRGIFHQAKDLILRDVVVHHCQHGILGADQGSGSCLLEYSEVYACGSGDRYHQIYMATDEVHNPGSFFRMQFCYVHDGAGGNNVKSRAERNEIYYNWIEGGYYHELELIGPDGGDDGNPRLKREDSDVMGNVFWKKTKPAGDTEFFSVTRIGGDGTGESHGRYRFVNNTFLCGSRPVFRMFDSLESVEMHNNVFYRIDGSGVQIMRTVEALWTSGSAVIAGSKNWIQTGSTQIPPQWTGNLVGSDAGFADVPGGNLHPVTGSSLIDAGSSSLSGPPGFPFPSPSFPPLFHPPIAMLLPVGGAEARGSSGTIDIGAFESDGPTGVWENASPALFKLEQNFPNPFNPSTVIRYSLVAGGYVSLKVYDLLGQEIAAPVDGVQAAGWYDVEMDAAQWPGGVYFYRLRTGDYVEIKKMLLVK